MTLFHDDIRENTVSLLEFSILTQVQMFSRDISPVCC